MAGIGYKALGSSLVLAVSVLGFSAAAISQGMEKPGWLSRTSGELYLNDEDDARFSIESIQPILQSDDKTYTLFMQGRAALRDGDWTTNIGTGFRYLTPGQMWMFGVNGWYDRTYDEDHERWGVGGEIFGPLLTGRANIYEATSGTKIVKQTTTQRFDERAVDGYDLELEGPVPYLPWARIGVTYYKWDTTFRSDIDGFAIDLKMDLTERFRLEVGYQDDDVDEIVSASLRISLGKPEHVEYTAASKFRSDAAFTPRTVAKHTLDRVERHHDIVVERRTVSTVGASGGVVIGRGA